MRISSISILTLALIGACTTTAKQRTSDDDEGGSGGGGVGGSATSASVSASSVSSTSASSTATSVSSSTSGAGGGGPGCYAGLGACDPTVASSCNAGEACDLDRNDTFSCFPPPNDVAEGGACNQDGGPFCEPGLTCLNGGTCARFCCGDADCGGKTCTFLQTFGNVDVSLCQ